MSKYDIEEMIIWLHDQARASGNDYYRTIADTVNELYKKEK